MCFWKCFCSDQDYVLFSFFFRWRVARWRHYPSSSSSSPQEPVTTWSTSPRGTLVGRKSVVFVVSTSTLNFVILLKMMHWYILCVCVSFFSLHSFLELKDSPTPRLIYSLFSSLQPNTLTSFHIEDMMLWIHNVRFFSRLLTSAFLRLQFSPNSSQGAQ